MSRPGSLQVTLTIRPTEAADLDQLLAIENAAFVSDRLDRRALRHAIGSPTILCLAAVSGDRLLGYGMVHWRRRSRAANLTSLAVLPEAAGRGIGRLLLEAMERESAKVGARRLLLEVRTDNPTGKRLYESAGYRQYEVLEEFYEDGETALCFSKDLVPDGAREG